MLEAPRRAAPPSRPRETPSAAARSAATRPRSRERRPCSTASQSPSRTADPRARATRSRPSTTRCSRRISSSRPRASSASSGWASRAARRRGKRNRRSVAERHARAVWVGRFRSGPLEDAGGRDAAVATQAPRRSRRSTPRRAGASRPPSASRPSWYRGRSTLGSRWSCCGRIWAWPAGAAAEPPSRCVLSVRRAEASVPGNVLPEILGEIRGRTDRARRATRLHGTSARQPRRRRDPSSEAPRGESARGRRPDLGRTSTVPADFCSAGLLVSSSRRSRQSQDRRTRAYRAGRRRRARRGRRARARAPPRRLGDRRLRRAPARGRGAHGARPEPRAVRGTRLRNSPECRRDVQERARPAKIMRLDVCLPRRSSPWRRTPGPCSTERPVVFLGNNRSYSSYSRCSFPFPEGPRSGRTATYCVQLADEPFCPRYYAWPRAKRVTTIDRHRAWSRRCKVVVAPNLKRRVRSL